MARARRAALALLSFLLVASAATAQMRPLTTSPARLERYAVTGAALAFVASAVARLDDCAAPLEFQEKDRGSVQILEIICDQGDEPRFARLTFVRVKSTGNRLTLTPFRMEFLP